jgi:choline dehydrogenase
VSDPRTPPARTYDYIVVGAGSAGCVMAHRLSEDGAARVLVIEGGGTDLDQAKVADARLYVSNFGTDTDWGDTSVPQRHLNDRVIVSPVGRVIGGGSSINATVWLKGDKADYDEWERAAGPGWGFDAIVRNFKKTERYAGGEGRIRGGAGMIATRKASPDHPITQAFVAAACSLGQAEHADVNDIADTAGIASQKDINADAAVRRVSAAQAYLLPALSRPNLTLLTETPVERLEIETGRCRGVVARIGGALRRFGAEREVVLCAGGLQSPKLLMLSGVGPADHLRQIGIPVVLDAPAIGENLHDHLLVRLAFSARTRMADPSDTGHSGITYIKSRPSRAGPDIQIFGRQRGQGVPGVAPESCYTILAGLMKPQSRGRVRLSSAEPAARLLVDPNYLAEPADVEALVAGVEFGLAIGHAPSFGEFRKEQIAPPGSSRDAIVAHIRSAASTYYHYVGTCAMGASGNAPVDPHLRLRGIDALRIVDASVMPSIVSCNTNAPTLALAERAAEIMRGG